MKKLLLAIALIILVLTGAALFAYDRLLAPTESALVEKKLDDKQLGNITTLADKLDTPWTLKILPDNRLIVTERSGVINILGKNNQKFQIADVVENGEGGLLGLALDPDFKTNGYVFIYKTTGSNNKVERYRLTDNQLTDGQDIISQIPAAANHNGGAIEFGPDGKLYITTGDAQIEDLAQDRNSLAGKILRINSDGSVPNDNPFGNPVWSYGHRNPQGLAWDSTGRLWSTEHGPSGLLSGYDELNLITKGGNYGWPIIRGTEMQDGLIAPVEQSGADETWAPAGMTFADGNLYFTGLRGRTLYKAVINGSDVELSRHLVGEHGRLRSVTFEGDTLLIGTSNRDGRGDPQEDDDKIIKVPLQLL